MKKKIVSLLVAIIFVLIAFLQVEAVEFNEKIEENKKMFGFCYFENIVPGDYDPADKCSYVGGITILGGSEGTETTIYERKGGVEIAHFEGPQMILVFLMLGYHKYTENSQIFAGWSFGVFVHEK